MPGPLLGPRNTGREIIGSLYSMRSSGRHQHSNSLKHEVMGIVCMGPCQEEGGRTGLDANITERLPWAKAQVHGPWISSSHTTWEPVRTAPTDPRHQDLHDAGQQQDIHEELTESPLSFPVL